MDRRKVESVCSSLGYRFKDEKLLEEALTHPGIDKKGFNYERMEFLGDSVLGMLVAEMLFLLFPREQEGDLSRRYIGLVNREALAQIARTIGLDSIIILNPKDKASALSENTLANALEAIIAAIYLDGGLTSAKDFITQYWQPIARSMASPPSNFKTELQEWAQKRKLPLPVYRLSDRSGLDHSPVFTVTLTVEGYLPAEGVGLSKRAAEQEAAKLMLQQIGQSSDS